MTEPLVAPDFVRQCRELIDRIVASQDSNEKAMLERKLFERLLANRRPMREPGDET